METKNYVVKENHVENMFFCHLQVSKKFMKNITPQEAEFVEWMVNTFVHRTCESQRFEGIVKDIRTVMENLNRQHDLVGPFLVMTYSPLRCFENGFIRIERTSGRHQSLLLPIIDYRGAL